MNEISDLLANLIINGHSSVIKMIVILKIIYILVNIQLWIFNSLISVNIFNFNFVRFSSWKLKNASFLFYSSFNSCKRENFKGFFDSFSKFNLNFFFFTEDSSVKSMKINWKLKWNLTSSNPKLLKDFLLF